MSLMLDALKRIEAKHTFARLVSASSATRRREPVLACAGVPALAGKSPAKAGTPAPSEPEAIEVPPAFDFDHLADPRREDVALPGPLSLELALDDISDLIAEARLIDRLPPADGVSADRVTDDYVALLDAPALVENSAEIDLRSGEPQIDLSDVRSSGFTWSGDATATWAPQYEEISLKEPVAYTAPQETFELAAETAPATDEWLPYTAFVPTEPVDAAPEVAANEQGGQIAADADESQAESYIAPAAPLVTTDYFSAVIDELTRNPLHEREFASEFDTWGEATKLYFDPPEVREEPAKEFHAADDLPAVESENFAVPVAVPEAVVTRDDAVREIASELQSVVLDSEPAELATVAADQPEAADLPVVEPVGSDPYATIAWEIFRQLPQGRSQVVLFTSPSDGHGKTTTLALLLPHLARRFAGSVLVIDANTRNPDMARMLEVAATWRLNDVLAGATEWMNAVRPTSLPRVSLLPGGQDLSRQVNVQATARLFRELTSRYNMIMVDSASLAHEGPAQLAALCDATYLVLRLGATSRRIVRDAVRVVSSNGGRLLGCIAVDAGA